MSGVEELTETKDAVRLRMRALRKALPPEERARASTTICAKLNCDSRIAGATNPADRGGSVAVYLASPDEIDLTDFILEMLARGVTVAAPRWNGETYELAKLKSLSECDLRRGPMKILEPAEAEIVVPSEIAIWIVPGLAFTRGGKRLGYGGGWYDRLLAFSAIDSLKIGVAHEFQIVEDLPHEAHDILLDQVLTTTESRAIVSLGSNIKPRHEHLAEAIKRLTALPGTRLVSASSAIETEPVDVPEEFADMKFVNQAAIFATTLGPFEFSRAMHRIEDEMGRVRTVRNGPRTIDIDLIDFDGLRIETPELILPHPRAASRDFVMKPLSELVEKSKTGATGNG